MDSYMSKNYPEINSFDILASNFHDENSNIEKTPKGTKKVILNDLESPNKATKILDKEDLERKQKRLKKKKKKKSCLFCL